jgi:hypothetical protein
MAATNAEPLAVATRSEGGVTSQVRTRPTPSVPAGAAGSQPLQPAASSSPASTTTAHATSPPHTDPRICRATDQGRVEEVADAWLDFMRGIEAPNPEDAALMSTACRCHSQWGNFGRRCEPLAKWRTQR